MKPSFHLCQSPYCGFSSIIEFKKQRKLLIILLLIMSFAVTENWIGNWSDSTWSGSVQGSLSKGYSYGNGASWRSW